MEDLEYIKESDLEKYIPLSSQNGFGISSQVAIESCYAVLDSLSTNGFGPEDTSTAHEVIDELSSQYKLIAESMSEVDTMIDALIDKINKEIIEKENKLATYYYGE